MMASGPNVPPNYTSGNLAYRAGTTNYPQTIYSGHAFADTHGNPSSMYPLGVQDLSTNTRGGYDPEYEQQLAQWQSAYLSKDESSSSRNGLKRDNIHASTTASQTSDGGSAHLADAALGTHKKPLTVVRHGGGKTWEDSSLLEWGDDPRLFVGNLAGEVTDDSLLKAFSKYNAAKARVIRDKRTSKSKGYGFVSFKNADDFFTAAKEMVGKYIGSHPVTIKKAEKLPTPSAIRDASKQHGGKNRKPGFRDGHANSGAGVRKPSKSKGPKLLG